MNREPDTVDRDFKFVFGEAAAKLASDVNLNDLPDDSKSAVTKATSTQPALVDINVPCFVTHDLNISPVEIEDVAGIPAVKTGLSIASIHEQDSSSVSVDARSSGNNATEFSTSEAPSHRSNVTPALHKSTIDIPVEVTVAVPLVEGKTPLDGAIGNVPPSQLSGDAPLFSINQLLNAPSKESHIDGVVVQQQRQDGDVEEIMRDHGALKSEPLKNVVLEKGGQDSAPRKDALNYQDDNDSVVPGEETDIEIPKAVENISSKAGELNIEAAKNTSADVLPLQGKLTEMPVQGIKQQHTQTAFENQERESEVNRDEFGFKGRKVLKRFGRKDFMGEVVSYEPECNWFKVEYEDGDVEDLERIELEAILLPVGTLPALALRKRPAPGGLVEQGYQRDSKKMKNIKPGSPYREKKERLKGSKKRSKSEVVMLKKNTQDMKHELLRGIQADSSFSLEIPKRPGKPCHRPVRKNKGESSCTTVSPLIEMKRLKQTKQDALGSPKGLSLAITGQHKLKGSKVGRQKSLQELEDVVEKKPMAAKGEFKKERRSGTSITLQEGIKRYLQKIQDVRQVHVSVVKQKTDAGENKSSRGKNSKKKAKEIIRTAIELNVKGTQSFKRGDRAGKHSTVASQFSNGDDLGMTLIGKPTRKMFSGKFYSGNVISYDMKTKFYKVRYEDGDQEDLEWNELEPTLVEEKKRDDPVQSLTSRSHSGRSQIKDMRRKATPRVAESLSRPRIVTRTSK